MYHCRVFEFFKYMIVEFNIGFRSDIGFECTCFKINIEPKINVLLHHYYTLGGFKCKILLHSVSFKIRMPKTNATFHCQTILVPKCMIMAHSIGYRFSVDFEVCLP